jgi:hypothetical protein
VGSFVTAAVVTLCVVVALLTLLVVALLRSHAEILRQLHELRSGVAPASTAAGRAPGFQTRPGVPMPRTGDPVGVDLHGVSPGGDAIAIAVRGQEHRTLVAFLSSGCLTCRSFWASFAQPEALGLRPDVRLVVVTKDPDQESVSDIATLAPAAIPVLMSTAAWDDYDVPMAPYFALVDGPTGTIVGEGASTGWVQVRELMDRALADSTVLRDLRTRGGATGGRDRDTDSELLRSGIEPGDPRLNHGSSPALEDPS